MTKCRRSSTIDQLARFLRSLLPVAVISYTLLISPIAAATLAVVYPDVPAPYRQVFEQIIEGIENQHQGPLVKYPISKKIAPTELLDQMGDDRVDMVVTLGRRGFSYNRQLEKQYPTVIGALPIKPNGISGVSLIAEPANLFEQLNNLSPKTRRVHVVYTDKSQWLINKAEQASHERNLQLVSYKATNINEAVDHYRLILKQAKPETDSIWLPLDTITANEKVILPLLLRESWDKNLVVFSSKPGHVKRGLLFTLFPDNTQDGVRLAEMLNIMFEAGKGPGVELSNSLNVAVNLRTASHLGLEYSQQMKSTFYQTFPQSGF